MQWLKNLLFRHRRYDDLTVSIQEHLDERIDELMNEGMSREQAAHAAGREFGNLTLLAQRSREEWQWPKLESLWADIRFAIRQLWKSPGFTVTAVATLALGIAATVVIFGFADSALLRPLPYRNPSRLVGVFESIRQAHRSMFSLPNYVDMERANRVFASVAAYDVRRNFVLTEAAGAQQVNGIGVTSAFFRTLGVTPVLGRDFETTRQDALSAPATVILSYAAWQMRFGGKSDVLGKAVTLNGEPYTIIGVLPRSFQFAPTGATEFWATLRPYATNPCELERGCHVLSVVARLKDGITLQQALANTQAIASRLEKRYPDADRDESSNIVPLSDVILGDIEPILLALLGGAGLLLLIAYVNLSSLLLVRSETRKHEFSIRSALGAAGARMVQQFMVEALVLVTASGVLGLLAAAFTRDFLLKLIPAEMLNSLPYLRDRWSWHVAVFSAALLLVACFLFAVISAVRLPLADLRGGLAKGGRSAAGTTWRRLGARLVILEIATTMVLLTGAGLLGKSFYKLLHVDIGFVPSHLATLQILAPQSEYGKDAEAIALQREILIRLRSLPGVVAAGTANGLPVGWETSSSINLAERADQGGEVGERQVSTGYFRVLEAQLLRGRYFTDEDNARSPRVVIINQSLASKYFPGENPIGKQIYFHREPQHPMEIVGVISDVKEGELDEPRLPFMYRPFLQSPYVGFGIVARTSQDAASLLPTLIATIHKIDPEIATFDVATMPEIMEDSTSAYLHRVSAWLAGGFATLALVLSIVGLYGVIAYSVGQRTREIGVRMALGARRRSVYELILKEAGWLILTGVVVGVAGAAPAAIFMRSLLFDVRSWDISILSTVAIVLSISALLASYVPARCAASIDPMQALRNE